MQSWQFVKKVGIIIIVMLFFSYQGTAELTREAYGTPMDIPGYGRLARHIITQEHIHSHDCVCQLATINPRQCIICCSKGVTYNGCYFAKKQGIRLFPVNRLQFPFHLEEREQREVSLLRSMACPLTLLCSPKSTKMGLYIKTPTRYWLLCQAEHVFLASQSSVGVFHCKSWSEKLYYNLWWEHFTLCPLLLLWLMRQKAGPSDSMSSWTSLIPSAEGPRSWEALSQRPRYLLQLDTQRIAILTCVGL